MKQSNRSVKTTLCLLLLTSSLCLLQTGCVHSETQLHNGITSVFDLIFAPLRIFTHQADNVSDSIH